LAELDPEKDKCLLCFNDSVIDTASRYEVLAAFVDETATTQPDVPCRECEAMGETVTSKFVCDSCKGAPACCEDHALFHLRKKHAVRPLYAFSFHLYACGEHNHDAVYHFCLSCRAPVCGMCILASHPRESPLHNVVPIEAAVEVLKRESHERATHLLRSRDLFLQGKEGADGAGKAVATERDTAFGDVDKMEADLHAAVHKRCDDLRAKITDTHKDKDTLYSRRGYCNESTATQLQLMLDLQAKAAESNNAITLAKAEEALKVASRLNVTAVPALPCSTRIQLQTAKLAQVMADLEHLGSIVVE
jgi:hypothetical protein